MSKADELKSYIPDYYEDVPEMDAILDTKGTEFEEYIIERDRTQGNLYITDSDDEGLSRWETILDIIPLPAATLADRAAVIISFLRGVEKLSASSIENITLAYAPSGSNVTFDGVNSEIVINFIDVGIPANIDALQSYLAERKPAHIGINYTFVFNTYDDLSAFTYDELSAYTYDELRDTPLV